MRRFLCGIILSLICIGQTAYAATPLSAFIEIQNGRQCIVKTFEATPEEKPETLIENPFELNGFSYAYANTEKNEIVKTETQLETRQESLFTHFDDTVLILREFAAVLEYEEDGFTGKLYLNLSSVKTEAESYATITQTVTDTLLIPRTDSNDLSQIPKTTERDGITLALQDVDWVVAETLYIDEEAFPAEYKAVAQYSGTYERSVPTGFITTAEYSGEVTKSYVDSVFYTLTYFGEMIPEPMPEPASTPMPTPEPTAVAESESEPQEEVIGVSELTPASLIVRIGDAIVDWCKVILILCLVILFCIVISCLVPYNNTYVYINDADDYQLIAKRRIKWDNPTVNLNGLNVKGKEVAIHVKKSMAKRLFGRYIKTVAEGDCIMRCLVNKQHSDFWYAVSIEK